MSLDQRPSDRELVEMHQRRTGPNGVRLGPESVLLEKRSRSKRASSTGSGRVDPTDLIDPTGRMNNWERQRAEQLELQRLAHAIRHWTFGSISIQLAHHTWYRPDFWIIGESGRMEIEEIKGHWEDDARVKIKVAARLYPHVVFRVLVKPKHRAGEFRQELVHP